MNSADSTSSPAPQSTDTFATTITTSAVLTPLSVGSSLSLLTTPKPPVVPAVSKADERQLGRLSLGSAAEDLRKKNALAEHQKRLGFLRKEAKKLERTNWQYEAVDKLLGRLNPKEKVSFKVDDNIKEVRSTLDFVVYSKFYEESWYIKCFRGSTSSLIFGPSLAITQVAICKNSVYGLSTLPNKLYLVNITDPALVPQLMFKSTSRTDKKLLQICANDDHLYALDDHSGVYRWPDLIFRSDNVETVRYVKIAVGFDNGLLLSDTGAVYSFGNGSRGQLGQPDIIMRSDTPIRIEFFDDLPCTITDIVCGGWHCLALTSDGDVYSFGWNPVGQLGHSADHVSKVVKDPYPVDLGSGDNPIVGIRAGARHSLALLKNGDVYAWGWNTYCQLGTGDNIDRPIPTRVEPTWAGDGVAYRVDAGRWSSFVYCKKH